MSHELFTRALLVLGLVLSIPRPSHGQSVGITPISDVTVTNVATLVKAGNSFRDSLSCTNHSTTVNVRWGDSTVTTTKGQRVPAGGAAEIRNRGPIYMVSEGANVTISCTEETR